MTFTAISYGGGVQSTALVVLAATGRIHADVALFANVGENAEDPATLAYVRDIAQPWAADHGLDIHEVQRHETTTSKVDLWDTMVNYAGTRAKLPIPVRAPNGAPMHRHCTADWKIKALRRWLTDHDHAGATSLIGISVDEIERARTLDADDPWPFAYPLLELGLTRTNCATIIRDADLPVPPKSSCYFCPFHRPHVWAELRRDRPHLFAKAQELEDILNVRQTAIGHQPVYLTRYGKRLEDAIGEAQPSLFDGTELESTIGEDGCDEGVCFV